MHENTERCSPSSRTQKAVVATRHFLSSSQQTSLHSSSQPPSTPHCTSKCLLALFPWLAWSPTAPSFPTSLLSQLHSPPTLPLLSWSQSIWTTSSVPAPPSSPQKPSTVHPSLLAWCTTTQPIRPPRSWRAADRAALTATSTLATLPTARLRLRMSGARPARASSTVLPTVFRTMCVLRFELSSDSHAEQLADDNFQSRFLASGLSSRIVSALS